MSGKLRRVLSTTGTLIILLGLVLFSFPSTSWAGRLAFQPQLESAGVMLQATKTITAMGDFVDPECPISEWHFIINQLDDPSQAPAFITVSWSTGVTTNVPLDSVSSGTVAHYFATSPSSGAFATGAEAVIDASWDGQFNLSDVKCKDTPTPTPTTMVTETPTATSTVILTVTPTVTPTVILTETPTSTPTEGPPEVATETPTSTPTEGPPEAEIVDTATPVPTATPTVVTEVLAPSPPPAPVVVVETPTPAVAVLGEALPPTLPAAGFDPMSGPAALMGLSFVGFGWLLRRIVRRNSGS